MVSLSKSYINAKIVIDVHVELPIINVYSKVPYKDKVDDADAKHV